DNFFICWAQAVQFKCDRRNFSGRVGVQDIPVGSEEFDQQRPVRHSNSQRPITPSEPEQFQPLAHEWRLYGRNDEAVINSSGEHQNSLITDLNFPFRSGIMSSTYSKRTANSFPSLFVSSSRRTCSSAGVKFCFTANRTQRCDGSPCRICAFLI